ncbi:unnamed protein product [Trichobilharzia regenti]|nr:unnamed protein product [Trichobilharzia regenti]
MKSPLNMWLYRLYRILQRRQINCVKFYHKEITKFVSLSVKMIEH